MSTEASNIPPFWKRWFICTFFRREEARIARAYNAVCVDLWKQGRHDTYEYLLELGYQKWQCVYGGENETNNPSDIPNYEHENHNLNFRVSTLQGRIEVLERENKLIKATAKRLAMARKGGAK